MSKCLRGCFTSSFFHSHKYATNCFCWGLHDFLSSLLSSGAEVVDLAFGSGPHVLALTALGELYSWGHNGYGQLGLGIGITSSMGTLPQRVVSGGLGGVRVTKVACGGHHTLVLSESGEVSVCVGGEGGWECVHVCVCIHMWYVCMCVGACVCECMHVWCVCMFVCVYTCMWCVYMYVCLLVYAYV